MVWARPRHCANPALQLKFPLKKTAKGTICPLQNLGKKLERKHTRRDLFQYRNCKLKQNVESIFYRTFKVHSKVTFQSRSTEHLRLMLNHAWWTRLAIVNMSHRKRVRTLESCFVPNQSQSESEKNDTEEEQCINQEETDEDRRKPKKITRSHVVVLWKGLRRCSAIFVRNLRRQTSLHQQKGVQISVPLKIKMSPKILAKGTNCPPVIKS